ncbi:MAG: transposase [Actinomycetia bacterium]|nr:transposase [Actinomycetes bacterium]
MNFKLMPRLKKIGSIRLSQPSDTSPDWAPLEKVLTRPIQCELIEQQ